MFSMPAPIPAAPGDYSSATKRHSPTATIPYPTHLSVTTPSSSRINGDWGFKRPLPLKTTTNTTFPLIRVRQVDSIEHVTDFQSSSDHTITLEKFQELNLPITVPPPDLNDSYTGTQRSVFEEDSDVTAIPEGKEEELENKRWRFKGPWLAGMTDGAFEKYLEKEVRGKRIEFRAFLKERLASEMTRDRAREASEKAVQAPETVTAGDVTEKQLTSYMKRLRNDPIELYQVVGRFLDLAPLSKTPSPADMRVNKAYLLQRSSPYSSNGPPITHPSAGLSYLRTRDFQENHPLYGPQRNHAPVEARVVMPRHQASAQHNPVIGVGGFIVATESDSSFNTTRMASNRMRDRGLIALDLETPGGAKKFSDVKAAHVDSTGKVIMRVGDADPMTELVQKETLGRADAYNEALRNAEEPEVRRSPRREAQEYRVGARHTLGSRTAYGLDTPRTDFSRDL